VNSLVGSSVVNDNDNGDGDGDGEEMKESKNGSWLNEVTKSTGHSLANGH